MMRFADFAEINPRLSLQTGSEYPFVEMAQLAPGQRYVTSQRCRPFAGGGSKFQHGDVLFARITPCLENGKIAQYCGDPAVPAFGSTEFFVFRRRQGVSDAAYLFYLALSRIVREPAVKSMSGASGRQRADLGTVANLEITPPPLPTQRKIASILSAYDDLVENNTRRIAILEEMARNLYREWFVHFRFPGHEGVPTVDSALGPIPDGWEAGRLEDALLLQRGFDLPTKQRAEGNVPVYAATGIVGTHNEARVKAPGVVTGRSGSLGTVMYVEEDFWPLNTALWVKEFRRCTPIYAFYMLSDMNLAGYNSGAAVPTLNRNDILGLPALLPSDQALQQFDDFVLPLFALRKHLQRRNRILSITRDLLLPRLISGELEVSDLPICTEGIDT
jgi:type I restriction enzyme S subunit